MKPTTLKAIRPSVLRVIPADPISGETEFSFERPSFLERFSLLDSDRSQKASKYLWKSCQHYSIGLRDRSELSVGLAIPGDNYLLPAYQLNMFDVVPWLGDVLGDVPGEGELVTATSGQFNYGLPKFRDPEAGLDGSFILPPDDLDDLVVTSLKTMLPHVKADLSLINSLIELKDFRSVKHSLSGIAQLFRGAFSSSKTATLRQLLQSTADGFLQTKFNFLPLWSDIRGIHHALTVSLDRLRAQINSRGSPLLSHFRREIKEFDDVEPTSDQNFYFIPDLLQKRSSYSGMSAFGTFYRSVQYLPTSFHAQVQYCANYTAFQVEHARGLALLDSLGVNLDPAIVWNAIPWSFVVDWVANVGEYLHRFAKTNMEPKINVLQYLWSVRRERSIRVTADFVSDLPPGFGPNTGQVTATYPEVVEVAYRRQVGLPDASSFLTSGLNLNEFTLAAALAITRKPKRKLGGRPKVPHL